MLDMGQTKVEGVDQLVGASLALIHIYELGKESTSHCPRRPDVRRRIFEKIADSVHISNVVSVASPSPLSFETSPIAIYIP